MQMDHRRAVLSIVVPVYRNVATIEPLCERLHDVLTTIEHEVILVNDASPDHAEPVLRGLAERDKRVGVISLRRNRGQHFAALVGVAAARGDLIAIMDGDLQDPPEALPQLVEHAHSGAAVFAGRRGRYESSARLLAGRLYRIVQHTLTGVPRDAGIFLLMHRTVAVAVLEQRPRFPSVVAMVGCATDRLASIPVTRRARTHGTSSYSHLGRLRLGARMLACVAACRFPGVPFLCRPLSLDQEVASRTGRIFSKPDVCCSTANGLR